MKKVYVNFRKENLSLKLKLNIVVKQNKLLKRESN